MFNHPKTQYDEAEIPKGAVRTGRNGGLAFIFSNASVLKFPIDQAGTICSCVCPILASDPKLADDKTWCSGDTIFFL